MATRFRRYSIPLKAAGIVAVLTGAALLVAAGVFVRIDREAREVRAADAARREFTDLAEKLPGLTTDPEMAALGRNALAELITLDSEGTSDRLVRVAEEGLPPQSATTRQVLREQDTDYAGYWYSLADGGQVFVATRVEGTGPLRQGFWRWGVVIALLITAVSAIAALVTARAITRRVEDLNALCARVEAGDVEARLQITGNDEIDRLSGHMNNMLSEMQRRLEALRDTTDGLAHDLRTPLARVQTRLSRIEAQSHNGPVAVEVGLAVSELSSLMDAFNALLALREIETETEVTSAVFDLSVQAENAIELYEALAEDERGIRIDRELRPINSAGNASLIVRAVANLIDNAIKASPDGAVVTVRTYRDGTEAVIEVQDNGVGLLPSGAERPSTLGGHGIGLRIVKAVAKRHGGRFSLSDLGSGALAQLRLPKAS